MLLYFITKEMKFGFLLKGFSHPPSLDQEAVVVKRRRMEMWVDIFKQRVCYEARLIPDILKLKQAHKIDSLVRSPW